MIAGKIVRNVQSSRIEDPTKDDQMTRIVRGLDQELAGWVENLPHNVRYAANDRSNPKMLALCLIAFFVYYSAIINLRLSFQFPAVFSVVLMVLPRPPVHSGFISLVQ